jgi:hypothetical protein
MLSTQLDAQQQLPGVSRGCVQAAVHRVAVSSGLLEHKIAQRLKICSVITFSRCIAAGARMLSRLSCSRTAQNVAAAVEQQT